MKEFMSSLAYYVGILTAILTLLEKIFSFIKSLKKNDKPN